MMQVKELEQNKAIMFKNFPEGNSFRYDYGIYQKIETTVCGNAVCINEARIVEIPLNAAVTPYLAKLVEGCPDCWEKDRKSCHHIKKAKNGLTS